MEFRAFNFETRSIDDDGKFEGYASVFGSVAQGYGTVMDKGCFLKTIKDNKGFFPLLWFHNPTTPVGSFVAEEDKKGLLVHGDVDLDVEPGQRMYSGMKKGYIDRMSIGFDRIKEVTKDDLNHITEAKLWESSLITRNFAADEQALISDVRATSAGLQRVRHALKDGAILELQNALVDLRCLLENPQLATPFFGDMQSETICGTMKEIKALLIGEKPALATSVDGKPPLVSEPHLHSLSDELRAFARTLH